MSEFLAGFMAGAFSIIAIGSAIAGFASCVVGGRSDDFEPYDPEARP